MHDWPASTLRSLSPGTPQRLRIMHRLNHRGKLRAMPMTSFDTLPDDARVWVFGTDAPVDDVDAKRLLAAAEGFLVAWKAHGHPLTSAREWRDDRFLVVGVDQRTEGASGCSIDGLFRTLKGLEEAIGTSLVGGG